MHDGMQYDPIQGQGQGHEPSKVGNSTIFKGYLLLYTNLLWYSFIDISLRLVNYMCYFCYVLQYGIVLCINPAFRCHTK